MFLQFLVTYLKNFQTFMCIKKLNNFSRAINRKIIWSNSSKRFERQQQIRITYIDSTAHFHNLLSQPAFFSIEQVKLTETYYHRYISYLFLINDEKSKPLICTQVRKKLCLRFALANFSKRGKNYLTLEIHVCN